MGILAPDKLDLDAVVPHSLDNQFIPDDLLLSMVKAGLDFNSDKIKARRARLGKVEFMRSLLYSKQVVINRAFFVNTPYLYQNYASRKGALDFAKLIGSGAIIPFVTGKNLLEKRDFGQHPDGARALELLLPLIDHADKVSLQTGEAAEPGHVDPLQRMGAHFTALLAGLDNLTSEGCRVLLRELGAHVSPIPSRELAFIARFEQRVKELAALAQAKHSACPAQTLTRDEVYRKFFCIPDHSGGNPVANGRFLPQIRQDSTLILLKRMVDIVYNFNLPDHLDRFSMTAPGMAGRTPLDVMRAAAGTNSSTHPVAGGIDREEEQLIEKARQINAKYMKESVEIPFPHLEKLSIESIIRLRDAGKWTSFIDSKSRLLKVHRADDLLDAFDEYVQRHHELHQMMFLLGKSPFLPRGVARVTPYIDVPILKLISAGASAAGMDGVSELADWLEAMPKEAALEFGMSWLNLKRAKAHSSLIFRGIQKLEVPARQELFRLGRDLNRLEAGPRPHDNGPAEQSKP